MSTTGWANVEDFNYDNVSEDGPPALDAGIYEMEIVSAKAELTKKGLPAIRLQHKATRSYNGDLEVDGRAKVYSTNAVTAEALFKIKNLARCVGATPPPNSSKDALDEFCREVLGAKVYARVSQREYPIGSGKMQGNVDRYLDETQAAEQAAGGAGEAAAAEAPAAPAARARRGRAAAE